MNRIVSGTYNGTPEVEKSTEWISIHRFNFQRVIAFSWNDYILGIFYKVTNVSYGFILLIYLFYDDLLNFIKTKQTEAALWVE